MSGKKSKDLRSTVFKNLEFWASQEISDIRFNINKLVGDEHVDCDYGKDFDAGCNFILDMTYAFTQGARSTDKTMPADQHKEIEAFERFWCVVHQMYMDRQEPGQNAKPIEKNVHYYFGAYEALSLIRAYYGKGGEE